LSPHQVGFNDVLALAQLNGRAPETVVAIGVQPVELNDFGGSLREPVRNRLPEAVALAADELANWGFPGEPRAPGAVCDPLNASALALEQRRLNGTEREQRGHDDVDGHLGEQADRRACRDRDDDVDAEGSGGAAPHPQGAPVAGDEHDRRHHGLVGQLGGEDGRECLKGSAGDGHGG